MPVLSLVKNSNKDTVEALESLLALARRNELRGTAIYFQDTGGYEDAIFTGLLRSNRAEALKGVALMWKYLTQLGERLRGRR